MEDGGADPVLKVDGFNGPKTEAAIENFQVQRFGPTFVDVRVDPGKRSVLEMTKLLAAAMRVATLADYAKAIGISEVQIQQTIDGAFEIARKWLLEANIRVVIFRDTVDPLVEKYFRISRQSSRRGALVTIRRLLERMKSVVDTPAIERALLPEPVIRKTSTLAWCEAGGIDSGPNTLQFLPVKGGRNVPIHSDQIYYTMRFVLLISQEAMAYAIVHELAHFVSSNPLVHDFAYKHREPKAFDSLAPHLRIINADHYAMYVLEAGTGSDVPRVKPPADDEDD